MRVLLIFAVFSHRIILACGLSPLDHGLLLLSFVYVADLLIDTSPQLLIHQYLIRHVGKRLGPLLPRSRRLTALLHRRQLRDRRRRYHVAHCIPLRLICSRALEVAALAILHVRARVSRSRLVGGFCLVVCAATGVRESLVLQAEVAGYVRAECLRAHRSLWSLSATPAYRVVVAVVARLARGPRLHRGVRRLCTRQGDRVYLMLLTDNTVVDQSVPRPRRDGRDLLATQQRRRRIRRYHVALHLLVL